MKAFWQNRKMIGSLRPSSRYLTHKMLRSIDFEKPQVIVELGPGTGVFTREILANMSPDSTLIVFEINTVFYHKLQENIKDPRCKIVNESAEKLRTYLKSEGFEQADVVISSLPLANFSKGLRKQIVRSAKAALKKNAPFIQFQYSLQSKRFLYSEFSHVNIDFTFLNLPPAFIYVCRK